MIDEFSGAERALPESGKGSTEVTRWLTGGPNKKIGVLKGTETVREGTEAVGELAVGSNEGLASILLFEILEIEGKSNFGNFALNKFLIACGDWK